MIRSALIVALLISPSVLAQAAYAQTSGIVVTSTPPGAEVRERGRLLGKTPVTIGPPQVTLGRHALTITLDRHEPQSLVIVVRALRVTSSPVKLVAKPVLELQHDDPAFDGATVSVDGIEVARLPNDSTSLPLALDKGDHVVQIDLPNFEPWRYQARFRTGTVTTEQVVLRPLFGTLVIGRAGTDDLVGVPLFLDGKPFGVTPRSEVVTAGRHQLEYRYAGIDWYLEAIDVPANNTLTLPVEMPELDGFGDTWGPADRVEPWRARAECESNEPSANSCIVAAHHEVREVHRLAQYRRACDLDDSFGCYAYAYLRALQRGPDATTYFAGACGKGLPAACWAAYAPLAHLPDPRTNAGYWRDYRKRGESNQVEIGAYGLTGVAVDRSAPTYLEGGLAMAFELRSWAVYEVELGLRALALDQRDATKVATDYTGRGGVGVTLGVRFRTSYDATLSLRVAGRATGYVAADDSIGGLAALNWKRGSNGFELGVMRELVPTVYQDVDAFGGRVRVERTDWLWAPFFKFVHVLESKKRNSGHAAGPKPGSARGPPARSFATLPAASTVCPSRRWSVIQRAGASSAVAAGFTCQITIVPSSCADATSFPSGLNRASRTNGVSRSNKTSSSRLSQTTTCP